MYEREIFSSKHQPIQHWIYVSSLLVKQSVGSTRWEHRVREHISRCWTNGDFVPVHSLQRWTSTKSALVGRVVVFCGWEHTEGQQAAEWPMLTLTVTCAVLWQGDSEISEGHLLSNVITSPADDITNRNNRPVGHHNPPPRPRDVAAGSDHQQK